MTLFRMGWTVVLRGWTVGISAYLDKECERPRAMVERSFSSTPVSAMRVASCSLMPLKRSCVVLSEMTPIESFFAMAPPEKSVGRRARSKRQRRSLRAGD